MLQNTINKLYTKKKKSTMKYVRKMASRGRTQHLILILDI